MLLLEIVAMDVQYTTDAAPQLVSVNPSSQHPPLGAAASHRMKMSRSPSPGKMVTTEPSVRLNDNMLESSANTKLLQDGVGLKTHSNMEQTSISNGEDTFYKHLAITVTFQTGSMSISPSGSMSVSPSGRDVVLAK